MVFCQICSEIAERAADAAGATVEDMGVNFRGLYVRMAELFLHRANVCAGLQKMGSERVAQGMAADLFLQAAGPGGSPQELVDIRLVHMVAPQLGGAGLEAEPGPVGVTGPPCL